MLQDKVGPGRRPPTPGQLKWARKQWSHTQTEAAILMGVSPSTVSRWERGAPARDGQPPMGPQGRWHVDAAWSYIEEAEKIAGRHAPGRKKG